MTGKSFIAYLHTSPEKRDEMIALQVELKQLVFEQEPDALVYELLQSDADPDQFAVVATFRDDAAFDKHMGIDFHDRLVPPILATLAEEMKIAYYRSHN
jgi:quinol monooxygenase YgiN